MVPFQKILVGTDFSEPAAVAMERAIDVAQHYKAALYIVHVWDLPALGYAGMSQSSVDLLTPMRQAAEEQLQTLMKELRARKIEVEGLLEQGIAWDKLLSTADSIHADLVVVGTHGRTGIRRALLGSVAERVVRLAKVPVLAVH